MKGFEEVNKYKFRAECYEDVKDLAILLRRQDKRLVLWIIFPHDMPGPDVVAEIKTYLSLYQVWNLMREIEDGHVMVETIAPHDKYTGERASNRDIPPVFRNYLQG